ncbi:MAG: amidohydrolase family protein, partial [Planctomycetaceae bacterium]|nr:amidohydrolase family protein [Planctomycetaceae bacterium]
SELIPVARSGGITTIMIRPSGGVIAGQTSIAQLSGWTAPEMVKNYEAGLQVIWPTAKKQQDELHEFLEEARLYDRLRTEAKKQDRLGPLTDPRLEALRPYIKREKPVFVEAQTRKAIAEALLFAEKEKLDIILTGGTDAWKLADELKNRKVPVILGPVMRSPMSKDDPSDAPYANAGRLFEAGVKFCIRSDDASNSRNAPFEAAMAVAYGLPQEQGLRAVTLSAAEVLGIEDQVGSLTPEKTASLVILDGGPLQHTSNIKGVFIAGKPFAPDSRQIRFYNRYRQRLLEHKSPTTKERSDETAE